MSTTTGIILSRKALKETWIDTRLGQMVAIADDIALLLLEFVDSLGLKGKIKRLK